MKLFKFFYMFFGTILAMDELNHVIEITQENFNLNDLRRENWMLFFGSPICPYCMKFLPIWKTLADMTIELGIKTGAINCLTDERLCKYFSIQKYPEVMFLKAGKLYQFSGERNIQNLVDFYTINYLSTPSHELFEFGSHKNVENSVNFWKIYSSFSWETRLTSFIPVILCIFALKNIILR